jgi:ribosome-binding factor A
VSRRAEQIASLLERTLQDVLARGLEDPRVKGLITVTGVSLTDDLQEATVLVSVLPAEAAPLTMHGLQHAARHLRRRVGERVALRRVPTLRFRLDESLKRQAEVLEALARIARERETGSEGHEEDGSEAS